MKKLSIPPVSRHAQVAVAASGCHQHADKQFIKNRRGSVCPLFFILHDWTACFKRQRHIKPDYFLSRKITYSGCVFLFFVIYRNTATTVRLLLWLVCLWRHHEGDLLNRDEEGAHVGAVREAEAERRLWAGLSCDSLHSDEECNYSRMSRHMASVQMCLHSALSWGWLITRDGGEGRDKSKGNPGVWTSLL